jgi:LPS-assembly protein
MTKEKREYRDCRIERRKTNGNSVKKFKIIIQCICILFSSFSLARADEQTLASRLGWVHSSHASVCHGYYQETFTNPDFLPEKLRDSTPVHIQADNSDFSQTQTSTLSGHVQIEQGDRQLNADKVYLHRDNEGEINTVELVEQVSLREPGKLFLSDYAKLDLAHKSADLRQVVYRLSLSQPTGKRGVSLAKPEEIKLENMLYPVQANDSENSTSVTKQPYLNIKLMELNGFGEAKHVRQFNQGNQILLTEATYSTCSPEDPTWQLKAQQIKLDRKQGRGEARHIQLNLKDVPILYLPYFNFPIDNRRNSGFLFPSIGFETDSGLDVRVPYYFNLAPNYDALFLPRYLSERGVMLGGKFRYLTEIHEGQIQASFLPNDQKFQSFKKQTQNEFQDKPALSARLKGESNNRQFFSWQDSSIFSQKVKLQTNFNWVSDDYYFQDLGGNLNDINTNQLEERADIIYQNSHWQMLGRVQHFQTLHPINQAPINELYSRVPQIYLSGQYPQYWLNLDYHLLAEWVNFDIKRNPGQPVLDVTGQRLFAQTGLSKTQDYSGVSITPAFYIQGMGYALKHTQDNSHSPARVFPIFNIDSAVHYTRSMNFLGKNYLQTLEPRVYYLFVPFVDQTKFPVFDTTLQPFNFEHLFRINRFDGFDRMNDANQLALGLTSSFISKTTGEEILHLGLGQIIYFRQRNVQLCSEHNCSDENNPTLVAVSSTKSNISPLVGEIIYRMDPAWSLRTQLALNVDADQVNNGNFYLRYEPKPQHILNVGYVYIRDGDEIVQGIRRNLNQTDISFVWPLTDQWSMLGRWNYNLSHNYLHTYIAGLQYDSCCWALRAVASRSFKSLNVDDKPQYKNIYYLQWLLKGLGSIGTGNPGSLLTQGIPHYRDLFNT